MEIISLLSVLGIAVAGLFYALLLMKQVYAADSGTDKMKEIAAAVPKGERLPRAQFRRIGPLIIVITVLLFITYTGAVEAFRWGERSPSSLVHCLAGPWICRHAPRYHGNLRVAAAAMHGYGKAMQLGYRTGLLQECSRRLDCWAHGYLPDLR